MKTDADIDAASTKGWIAGYYCAVALLIRKQGAANTDAKELFREGAAEKHVRMCASTNDIAIFVKEGLMPCNCNGQLPHEWEPDCGEPK